MKQRVVFSFIKNFMVKAFSLFILSVFSLLLLSSALMSTLNQREFVTCANCEYVSSEKNVASFPKIKDLIDDFFGKNKKTIKDDRVIMVYPGGFPLGFTMECSGVIVVSMGEILTEDGMVNLMKGKNIKVGDVLHSINDEVITSASHMQELLNKDDELIVRLEIHRGSEIIKESVYKRKELSTKMYRLGLWVRDNTAGVGTLTYVREDNMRFGALGHPVCDLDTGKVMPVSNGNIYKCNIVGYNKGVRGNPGELRGLFLKTGLRVGVLDNNNNFGVYGKMGSDFVEKMNVKPVPVGFRDSVKTGKASILSTINGSTPEEYEIEIVKLSYQSESDKKSMVIRITDERLLNSTGGIVQGMSGSPILQNGKLIGAVTHVFVSDPTKGFGVYIDWMIDN